MATNRRGRGFDRRTVQPSNIDAHFSSGYNPALDVEADPDPNLSAAEEGTTDWDNALEALRDRRAWQAKQADRLREAGFGDEEIERWERTAAAPSSSLETEKDLADVRWRRKGEEREWDAGKPTQPL